MIVGNVMGIRLFREEDRERWDRYVNRSSLSTCYHLTGWKEIIENSFNHRSYYLLSEDSDYEVNGILPLIHLKSIFFGNFFISMPYFNYGGICAETEEIRHQLLEEAVHIAERENAEFIELRNICHTDGWLPVKTTKVSMICELPKKEGELWDSFPSKMRNQILRPSKEGMYSKIGKEEELDSFYTVFSINMRDLGTPVYSKAFFSNILNKFHGSTWICTVYSKEGQPVASGFLNGFKEKLEIPWASSIREYNRFSPNMLLYWASMKFACENGYTIFDFGRSTPGEGTYKFKEQWGARPIQLYWHYWMRNGSTLPDLNPKNPKYYMAVKIWKRLPVGLTRLLGPQIVKNIP